LQYIILFATLVHPLLSGQIDKCKYYNFWVHLDYIGMLAKINL